MKTLANSRLPAALIASLEKMLITSPTPIQKETIPLALDGLDLLASAQTGTGKTIAYLIPLFMKLTESPQHSALILAPTRELAIQVHQTLQKLLPPSSSFKTALLIGGAPMFRQMSELKRRPRLIVGTPGRINDHLCRGSLSLQSTSFLIIDEADRMLDMGFGVQLDAIAEFLPENRQTLMFSATVSPSIEKLSKKYLRNPQRISVNPTQMPAPKIKQDVIRTTSSEKQGVLLQQLNERQGSIIIFVKTKRKADSLRDELQEYGHNADAMHGDLPQRRRESVIRAFRGGKSRILVATDVAARGLDIPHVMHVINYDLPECPEDYIHRIGRTGRADAEGFALSLVSREDNMKWRAIANMMDPEAANKSAKPFDHKQTSAPRRSFQDKKPMKWDKPRRSEGFSKTAPSQKQYKPSQKSFSSHKSPGKPSFQRRSPV